MTSTNTNETNETNTNESNANEASASIKKPAMLMTVRGVVDANSPHMKCRGKCGQMKPFPQASARAMFHNTMPLHWPGRDKGICRDCGVADYNARVSIPWSEPKTWVRYCDGMDALATMYREQAAKQSRDDTIPKGVSPLPPTGLPA